MSSETLTDATTSGLSQVDLALACGIAILASLIFALIEIPSKSKASFVACLIPHSFLYWIVLSFGNVVTTLMASLMVIELPTNLSKLYFLLCAFFGVFGFEAILKNTNITMFDNGVLTIQNWIEKALNAAAASAIDRQELLKSKLEGAVIKKLSLLSEEEINTRILQKMGHGIVKQLDQAAIDSSANSKKYKILQLAAVLTRNESFATLKAT